MAQFELNIYGNNDEIIKQFETDHVRWGVFMEAFRVKESIDRMTPEKQFQLINNFVKKIFPDLTDEDLEKADIEDVMYTFRQLLAKSSAIGEGVTGKNG